MDIGAKLLSKILAIQGINIKNMTPWQNTVYPISKIIDLTLENQLKYIIIIRISIDAKQSF